MGAWPKMTTPKVNPIKRSPESVNPTRVNNPNRINAPEIVSALFKGMLRELSGDTKEKRFRKLLGREYMEAENLAPTLQNALSATPTLTAINLLSLDN